MVGAGWDMGEGGAMNGPNKMEGANFQETYFLGCLASREDETNCARIR